MSKVFTFWFYAIKRAVSLFAAVLLLKTYHTVFGFEYFISWSGNVFILRSYVQNPEKHNQFCPDKKPVSVFPVLVIGILIYDDISEERSAYLDSNKLHSSSLILLHIRHCSCSKERTRSHYSCAEHPRSRICIYCTDAAPTTFLLLTFN